MQRRPPCDAKPGLGKLIVEYPLRFERILLGDS